MRFISCDNGRQRLHQCNLPLAPTTMVEQPVSLVPSVEAQFRSRGIRMQETMLWHVVAALPESWITKFVHDNDNDINPKSCYDDLKHAMLESTKISEKGRFTALTSSLELGDQKPPEPLRHLEKLAEGRILGEAFLRQLFLRKLPGMARTLLATQPGHHTPPRASQGRRLNPGDITGPGNGSRSARD